MSQFYGQNVDGTYPVGYVGPRGTLTGGINNTGSAYNYGAGSGYRGGNPFGTSPFTPEALANAPVGTGVGDRGSSIVAGNPTPAGGNIGGGGGGFDFDFGDFAGNLFNTGLDYYTGQQGIDSARAAGGLALGTASGIGQTAADMAKFQPYTVTSNLAKGITDEQGGLDLQLSAEEQARQNQYLGQSQSMFGGLTGDVAGGSQAIYEQMRAAQRPEEERQRMRMQEGLFASGRGGLQSGMYGGGNAETFGFEQARQEAMLNAQLAARQQFGQEQAGMLQSAQGLQTAGYNPQRQAIDMFGASNAPASYADAARRQQGSLYGTSALKGLEGFLQGEEMANRLEARQFDALRTGMFGSEDIAGQATQSLFDYGAGAIGDYLGNAEWNPLGSNYQGYNVGGSRSTIGGTGMTSGGSGGSSQAGAYTGGGTGLPRGGDADNDGVLNVSDRYPLDPTRS